MHYVSSREKLLPSEVAAEPRPSEARRVTPPLSRNGGRSPRRKPLFESAQFLLTLAEQNALCTSFLDLLTPGEGLATGRILASRSWQIGRIEPRLPPESQQAVKPPAGHRRGVRSTRCRHGTSAVPYASLEIAIFLDQKSEISKKKQTCCSN